MASATNHVMISSIKLQREEMLDGHSSSAAMGQNPNLDPNPCLNPNPRVRTPRTGNTPLHSPRSMSPLRSPTSTEAAETASPPMVDFQEAILRASHMQKSFSMVENLQEEAIAFNMRKIPGRVLNEEDEGEEYEAPPALPIAVTRRKSEITQGQQQQRRKSPFPSGRMSSSEASMEQEASVPARRTRRTDMTTASSEWVLQERGKSPRRSKVSSSSAAAAAVIEETHDNPKERKSSRSSTRRNRVEILQDLPDADLGMGDANRATRRSLVRPNTHQHKRKASEPITVMAVPPPSPPEVHFIQRSTPQYHYHQQQAPEFHPPPYRAGRHSTSTSSPSTSSRRASREARASENSDWLKFMGDIIMWRHIPRSALLFGAGCFCSMSASLIQDLQYSAISVMAYVALFYLAAMFIKRTFLRGTTPASVPSVHMLTEAEALRLIRVLLPPINVMLQKLGELFSGEPMVTLKVAGALWFLAQAGSMMNLWTIARIAYFALFTVPKCYSSYSEQIQGQARNLLHWVQTTWNACGHKKAVLFAAFAVAWKFSSVSTCIFGAFLALVTLRANQHVIRSELEIGSNILNPNRPSGISSAPSHGFEAMAVSRSGLQLRR